VAGLYLLMNVSFLAALIPGEMAGSELVARDATAAVFGGGTVVLVASLLILISSLNVNPPLTPAPTKSYPRPVPPPPRP